MDFSQYIDAALLGFFLAFMIGPVFFILIQTSIVKGARAAIVFDFGVIIGDVLFLTVAYFGSRSLLEKLKDDPRLFFIGGVILIIYGIITYLDKSSKPTVEEESFILRERKNNYVQLFFKGFFLNTINVGVLAFWLGLIVVIGPNFKMDGEKITSYFAVVLTSYFITDIGKILLAKQLKKKLTQNIIYKVKRGMGILLIVFGVVLLLKGILPNEPLDFENVMEQTSEQ